MALLHMHVISQDFLSDSLKTVSEPNIFSNVRSMCWKLDLFIFRKDIGILLQQIIFSMHPKWSMIYKPMVMFASTLNIWKIYSNNHWNAIVVQATQRQCQCWNNICRHIPRKVMQTIHCSIFLFFFVKRSSLINENSVVIYVRINFFVENISLACCWWDSTSFFHRFFVYLMTRVQGSIAGSSKNRVNMGDIRFSQLWWTCFEQFVR